ncbi:MAG TPA: alpha/beta hydrolase [Rhizomicrobium sp.]|nr:alpha/beta hydrolase [Rhizomicrobium sp.]
MADWGSARAALGAQAPFEMIDAGGTQLAVMRRGRGRPLVCLHAIAHGARDFDGLAAKVGDAFEIVAVDWPGHGLSPDDGIAPSARHYGDVTMRLLDALKLEKPILLGNSIGGATALTVAAARGEEIGGLVLCNAGGLRPLNGATRFAIGRMAAFFRAGELRKKWFGPAYRFYYSQMVLPRAPKEHCERIIAAGYELAPKLRQAWEGFAEPQADIRGLVAKVTCPILFAWAKSDRLIPWSGSRAAAMTAKMPTVALLKGGHSAFVEDTDQFARVLRKFAYT